MDSAENIGMMYQAFKVEVNIKSINNVTMPATGDIIISIKDCNIFYIVQLKIIEDTSIA